MMEVAQSSLPSAAVALRDRWCSRCAVKTMSDASIADAMTAPSLVIQRMILSMMFSLLFLCDVDRPLRVRRRCVKAQIAADRQNRKA